MKTPSWLRTVMERWRTRTRRAKDVESLAHLDDHALDDIGAPSWICRQVSACRQQRARREAATLDGGGVLPW